MNFRNSYQIKLLTIVNIFLLLACQKKDEILPQLTVSSPNTNSQYYAIEDAIVCAGQASDDVELDRVEFQLQSSTGSPVMPKMVRFADVNPFDFAVNYELDDIQLESGNYLMKITTYDKANNFKSIYREVIIFGVPRVKQGVFYVADNGSSFTLGRIDSLDQDSIAIGNFPDFGGMTINNYDQQLFYMGYESTDLLALNSRNYTIEWSLSNFANPPGTYYFHELNYSSDGYLSISLFQNEVLKRFQDGSGTGNILLNYIVGRPETTFKDGSFLYVESLNPGTGIRRFQRYFFGSGVFDEDYAIDYDFRKILAKGNDELLIFGEASGQAIMKIFYKNGGNYFQPLNMQTGSFIDAFRIDDNNYLIVQDQSVSAYTYSNNNLITTIGENGILSADYDIVNDRIYLGFANLIKVYSSSGVFIRNIPVSGDVINIKVHYNK